MDRQELLLNYINRELLGSSQEVTSCTRLFSDNLLDSMDLAELIEFLERDFQIKVSPMDIVIENLDSVDNILSFVDRKQATLSGDL